MICKKCGNQVNDNASFCPYCGVNLKDSEDSQSNYDSNQNFNQNTSSQNSYYYQNQQSSQNGGYQNQQFSQNGGYQNQQFNQNGGYQNQQFGQNGNYQYQQFNQNGYPQGGMGINNIRERNIVQCILLSIVTCGIYAIVWFVSMVDDLNMAAGNDPNAPSGGMVFLLGLITCNIYTLYWMYKAGESMNIAKQKRGLPIDANSGILYLVLTFFGLGIVTYCLIQSDLNQMAAM